MAEENNDAASKTEEPTARKLQQAREKGDVAKTPDLAQLASFAGAAGLLVIAGGWMSRNLANELLPFIAHPQSISVEGAGGVEVARHALMAAAPILMGVLFAAALAGVAGNLVQTGVIFNASKLAPDFSKVALDKGIQRLFGLDAVVHFGKSVLKIILVTAIAWLVLKPRMHEFQQMSAMEPTAILPLAVDLFRRLFYAVAGFLLLIAGFDWFWQRQRFMTRMRMTKEELKEDFKQTDGDPHIKARQKQIRMQRSRRRMMAAVPTATVVVMNPTHYAVALKYEPGDKAAPLCVAKGVDSLALKIRAVAEAAGVAVIEDPPLARALYATVEVEAFIPTRHYEAVAKIIGFVMQRARPAQRGT